MDEPRLLFGALLRAWRTRRGLSQLDLALEAEVSSRHVSFLETGRASPSEAMVLRLASSLDVPLRDQNELLRAAGLPARFQEAEQLPPSIEMALERMMAQHEPFPMVVLDAAYRILRANRSAQALFAPIAAALGEGAAPSMLDLFFDPRALRPHVVDWPTFTQRLLSRLRRERLAAPDDGRLATLHERLLRYPDVQRIAIDPTERVEPVLALSLRLPDATLSFLTTVTTFSAAQDLAVAELRIESLHPEDEVTRAYCEARTRPA